MALFDFLNFLLNLNPAVSIFLISAFVTIVTTLVYKYTTNQKQMKEIRDDVKRMQTEMRNTKDPAQMAVIQKQMMSRSMQQMNSSLKSTLITLIPLFLLFAWIQGHLAYDPISPGEDFTTTATFEKTADLQNITLNASQGMTILDSQTKESTNGLASWKLKSNSEGTYKLTYSFANESYSQNVVVSTNQKYENPILSKVSKPNAIQKNSQLSKIAVNLDPLRPFGTVKIFGWRPGWFATYLIFSLVMSMLFRKWLRVY